MKENPKVCVLMPVYNGEKTIKFAINSLLRQTYDNWFCIIVNDGSTDGTKQILDAINDNRFLIYHLEKNRGRGFARDEALKLANGEYLAYLDADDLIHEDKIRSQVNYLESHPEVDLVGCGDISYDLNFHPLKSSGCVEIKSQKQFEYGQRLPIILASSMVRLKKALMFRYNHYLDVGEDYDYFARYCEGGYFANMPNAYYYYLVGSNTRKKILYYQFSSIKLSIVMIQRGLWLKGMMDLLLRVFKYVAYFCLIPIFGVDKVVNFRNGNTELSTDQKEQFELQIRHIISL